MEKAKIRFPKERVFLKNLLVFLPFLPTTRNSKLDKDEMEVNVLEVNDDKALILLPKVLGDKKETATIDTKYLL